MQNEKKEVREFIRRRAVELADQGKPLREIAFYLGTTPSSVGRWRQLARSNRPTRAPKKPGPPRRISKAQLRTLERLLKKGAKANGWSSELWTLPRIGELIEREFGISYSKNSVWKIVRNDLGWTSQKPIARYGGRNEEKIRKWPRTTFRRAVSEAKRSGWHIAFADEAGFMLMPTLRRSYSPRGVSPVIKTADPHGRISTAGAITLSPKSLRANLHVQMLPADENYTGHKIAGFLSLLADRLDGPFLLFWDCIPIHFGRPVKELLRRDKRIHLRALPKYAPELNPADKVWSYLKYSRLANFTPQSTVQLRERMTAEILAIKKNTQLIHSFVRATGLDPYGVGRRT